MIVQDANITQKYQELLRKLESIGGQKTGRHVVHCRLFNRKTTTGAVSVYTTLGSFSSLSLLRMLCGSLS